MRTIMRACVLFVSMLCFNASLFSQQVSKSIPNSTSPDGIIGFLQFTPSDYGSQKHPLIIFLHGIGERGNGTPSQLSWMTDNAIPKFCAAGASMRFTVNGQTSSFVVLSPQLSTQYGYWPTFYVTEMIKYAKANLTIDTNRIYLCGLSLGGGGVWRALTETNVQNGDYTFDAGIAAATPVCGTQEENDGYFCNTIGANHVPIWAFHSMDDGTVPVQATEHAQILAANCGVTPAPLFTYYQSGGHAGAWINAYDTGHITVPTVVNGNVVNFTQSPNLFEWLLSNKRGTTTTPANTAPVANAGTAQTITLPASTVTLDGSASKDPNGSIVSYVWTQTSGPTGPVIANRNVATTSVTGLLAGTYTFVLQVTDNGGLTSYSSVVITVNAATANQTPIANAGTSQTITLPTNAVTLNSSGSYDPDGSIVSYVWTQTSGPTGPVIANRNAAATNVTGLVAGTYTFVLQVTDNGGLSAYSSTTLTVNAVAANAVAQILSSIAGTNQTISLPANSVTLDGTASNDQGGGYITGYIWTQTSGPVGPVITNRNGSATTVTGLLAGMYSFDLEVIDNNGLTAYSNMTLTVNPASGTSSQPIGYIKQTLGLWQACTDASSNGRIPIYCNSIANGSIVYLDAGLTSKYNGGWNWFSFTPVLGGPVTEGFSVFPDGTIHLLSPCASSGTAPVSSANSGLLGYVKISVGPYQACADASTDGRIPIYGTYLATDGTLIYTDAAMTQIFNGGWNWYSFTPTIGSQVTYAFVIYPIGSIGLLRSCSSSSKSIASGETLVQNTTIPDAADKLNIYPNPVHSSATIQLNSSENGTKTINLYNASGVLTAKYNWQTFTGNNTYSLKDISGLAAGLYIADIRDSNGKSVGKIKFVKQ